MKYLTLTNFWLINNHWYEACKSAVGYSKDSSNCVLTAPEGKKKMTQEAKEVCETARSILMAQNAYEKGETPAMW